MLFASELNFCEYREMQAFFAPGDDCRLALTEGIEFARSHIRICVFTLSDDRLVDVLVRAHREGLSIQLLSDNDKAFDKGSDIIMLAQAGLDVRVDCSPNHMHHKFMVVDDLTLFTGSYNWTRSAEHYNNENLLRIEDSGIAQQFDLEFQRLWAQSQPALDLIDW